MRFPIIIFFTFVAILQITANIYIGQKLIWLAESFSFGKMRLSIIVAIAFLASAFVAVKILSHIFVFPTSNFFYEFLEVSGSIWFGFLAYFILSFLSLDIIFFLVTKIVKFEASTFLNFKKYSYLVAILGSSLFLLWGYYNAHNIQIVHYNVKTNLSANDLKKIKLKNITIGVASDIHLGAMITQAQTEKIIRRLLSFEPQLILLVGDTLDANLSSVLYHNSGAQLKSLYAPLGVYAVLGNHEYIGNVNANANFLKEAGIRILQDECVVIDNSFILLGRDDAHTLHYAGITRKSLPQILATCGQQENANHLPIIVLDHQPVAIEESQNENVLLHLSGHTHHGQLFPFSFVTRKMFALSYGIEKFKNTWVYVSSGAGYWGPPFRTSGKAEVIQFVIDFE